VKGVWVAELGLKGVGGCVGLPSCIVGCGTCGRVCVG
jgi:hypothetical protein